MSATFESLGLSPESLDTLRRARFSRPTPIQAQAIPPALAGRDVVGCAATGTGKTAAFLLPLMERLRGKPGTRALVLAPTRELVMQISEQVRFFGEAHGVTHAVLIGGEDLNDQIKSLRDPPTFIVATPGRLIDLIGRRAVNVREVEALVLDEADRMLDMGFQPQLEEILQLLPRERQSLLFSATLGHDVREFSGRVLRKPVRVEVTPSGTPAPNASQKLYRVTPEEKYALLLSLIARDDQSALVFTATKERAEKVQAMLKREGFKAACIHGDRTQNQRKQALQGFERGQYRCLVATDIAARGLDVENIGHVINFDLPHSPEDYVHRIGRTARAGQSGRSSTFATEDDAERIAAIEKVIRSRIPKAELPRRDPVFLAELERYEAIQLTRPAKKRERALIGKAPARGSGTRGTDQSTRGGAQRGPPKKEGAGRPGAARGGSRGGSAGRGDGGGKAGGRGGLSRGSRR